MKQFVMGWSRDCHGKVTDRHPMRVCNALTSMSGGGHTGEDGLGNTTPYVVTIYAL